MKSVHYSLSDSGSETEDPDNDDIIFNIEAIKSSTDDCVPKFDDVLISPLKEKKHVNLKRAPKTTARSTKKKVEKKTKVEVVKQPKPAELMKLVSVIIDSSLLNNDFGSELLMALRSADIRYSVQEQKQPSTITWIAESDQSDQKFFDNYIIFLWTWKDLIQLISEGKLSSDLEEKLQSSRNAQLTLIIFGIEEYFRKSKSWKNRETNANPPSKDRPSNKANNNEKPAILSRIDVEFAVGKLQFLKLQYKFIETSQDLGLYIAQFTKALTELPLKLEKNKKLECADWYATGDSRECVRVDTAGNGLLNLWQQQICQFPLVNLDIAQAIVSNYKSPLTLMNAYDSCSSREEAELLLQNIPVRRVHGPLTSVRRIGPELSKKIHQFFCCEDGDSLIS